MRYQAVERPDLPAPVTPHEYQRRYAGAFPQRRGRYQAVDVMARHWTKRERPPSWYRVYRLADRNAPTHRVLQHGKRDPVPQLFIFVRGVATPLATPAAWQAMRASLLRSER